MNYTEIEIEGMKEILKDKEEYIKKLEIDKIHWRDLYWEECEKNKKLNERIRFLEQCLDNKEKVNKSLREDLKIWKLTAKDYAKLFGVDLDDK